MKRRLSRRPSPSMAVALLALFVALGGVSYGVATNSIGSREIKNDSVRSKDIRNGTILSRDMSRRARRALRGFKGDRGDPGPAGTPGTALAYARITNNPFIPDDRVDEASSRGVTDANVTFESGGGAVCFNGLPFNPSSVVANLETGPADVQLNTRASSDIGDALCAGEEAASVVLRDDVGNVMGPGAAPYSIYVLFN